MESKIDPCLPGDLNSKEIGISTLNSSDDQDMEKAKYEHLRQYEVDSGPYIFYKELYINQNLKTVQEKVAKYSNLNNRKMTMHHALSLLDTFIDPSDPDMDLPNSVHAYQTAERARKQFPNDKEMQIVGLIHDLGKVLFSFGEPSWAVVGDTFVVGASLPSNLVLRELANDHEDCSRSELGIYEKNCGLNNLSISFGHDEYLYQVLKQNKNMHYLSEHYWDVIRYHSFYAWHTFGEYRQFMNDNDEETLKNVNHFNQFDLYSKADEDFVFNEDMKSYYHGLLQEYFPNELQW